MNNMAMNQFGMNPMYMNNNGMDQMPTNNIIEKKNNQQNIMDEDALRIKNIIQPYEIRIKELEDLLREKDFEIACLKDKLNINNNQGQINQLGNNNQMMINNMNNNNMMITDKGKEIYIIYENNKYNCFENEKTYKLFEKLNVPNWHLVSFNIEERKLYPFITIKQNKIKDGSIIKISRCKNISFRGNHGNIFLSIDENYPFKSAAEYFLIKIDKIECFKSSCFTYNIKKINLEDYIPMKEIFKNNSNPVVNYFNI
jgi:hypothetical protein